MAKFNRPNLREEGQRRSGFRGHARQSVVEFAEIVPATIHRLATLATLNKKKKRINNP
jgi:hypothetical protein